MVDALWKRCFRVDWFKVRISGKARDGDEVKNAAACEHRLFF